MPSVEEFGSIRRLTLQGTSTLPRGACSGDSMSAERGIVLACPIFTSGKRLRRRICLLVFFVFIRDIRGSRTSRQGGIWAALERGGVCEWVVYSEEEFGSCGTMTQGGSLGSAPKVLDDDAGEEEHGGEVGFGFGDGYDEATTTFEAAVYQSISYEAVA